MRSLRDEGMAILFISSELEEIVRDCQRVVVLRDRAKVGELSGPEINEARRHADHRRGIKMKSERFQKTSNPLVEQLAVACCWA